MDAPASPDSPIVTDIGTVIIDGIEAPPTLDPPMHEADALQGTRWVDPTGTLPIRELRFGHSTVTVMTVDGITSTLPASYVPRWRGCHVGLCVTVLSPDQRLEVMQFRMHNEELVPAECIETRELSWEEGREAALAFYRLAPDRVFLSRAPILCRRAGDRGYVIRPIE